MPAKAAESSLAHARNLVQSVADSPVQSATLLGLLAASALVSPVAALASGVAGMAFLLARPRPLRAPLGTDGPAARGVEAYPIGTEVGGGLLSVTPEVARRGLIVTGRSGPERSDAILGILEGAAARRSGFVLCDARGDVSLVGRVHAIAAKHGRSDDVLVLNLTGHRAPSNTINPYEGRTADWIVGHLVSLLDAMPGDRARSRAQTHAMLTGLCRALATLRDRDGHPLDARTVRDALAFEALVDLACPTRREGALPEEVRDCLSAYLRGVPGYQHERGRRQSQSVVDQHAFLALPVASALSVVAEAHAGALRCDAPEIDMADVIENRRILLVLLPALTGPEDPNATLGRAVAAAVRGAVSADAGPASGRARRGVFMCALDGIGLYGVEGIGSASSLARDGEVSFVFGAEDMEELRAAPLKIGSGIIANAGTHVALRPSRPATAQGLGPALGDPSLSAALGDGRPPPTEEASRSTEASAGDMTVTHGDAEIPARPLEPMLPGRRRAAMPRPACLVPLDRARSPS